jgi:hypothetical protein
MGGLLAADAVGVGAGWKVTSSVPVPATFRNAPVPLTILKPKCKGAGVGGVAVVVVVGGGNTLRYKVSVPLGVARMIFPSAGMVAPEGGTWMAPVNAVRPNGVIAPWPTKA